MMSAIAEFYERLMFGSVGAGEESLQLKVIDCYPTLEEFSAAIAAAIETASAKKDAERYRFLRSSQSPAIVYPNGDVLGFSDASEEQLDEAVDAAIAALNGRWS